MIERHIITGEFPPDLGGVGAHTAVLAGALAECGEQVHVWCPGAAGTFTDRGVTVHRELGRLSAADLRRVSVAFDRSQRRLMVQWVPHAFGRRSMNVVFCRWLRQRAARGDEIDVIVHEPYLPFHGSPGAIVAAAVHRLMVMLVLRAARRVWVVTPAWEAYLRPYARDRAMRFEWLPVPSTMPLAVRAVRPVGQGDFLIGSFATGEPYAERALRHHLLPLVARRPELQIQLLGRHSDALRAALTAGADALAGRIHASGAMSPADLSERILGCDAAIQPYEDGVCGRRTTAMAFLARGCPLVTTDGRFTEESWRGGGVVLVPSAAPDRLTAAMEQVIGDATERERLSAGARALYSLRFDIHHAAAALHAAAA